MVVLLRRSSPQFILSFQMHCDALYMHAKHKAMSFEIRLLSSAEAKDCLRLQMLKLGRTSVACVREASFQLMRLQSSDPKYERSCT
jgi:hypothetical protein